MSVHIVTDSTVRFSSDAWKDLPIEVIPLRIRVGDQTYVDRIEPDEALLAEQHRKIEVLSPTVDEFSQLYETLHRDTSEIISIHLPARFSDTVSCATQAADMLLGRCKIEVIDSQTISLGLGILVEAAARAAVDGQSMDDIVRFIRGLIPQIYIVFFSERLSDLEHANSIGAAPAFLGTMLGIKPLFTLEEGEIIPIEKVRTREHAVEKLIEFVTEFDAIKQIAIIKNSPEPTEETQFIAKELQSIFPELKAPVMAYGPIMASYIGPDSLGVVVYEDPEYEI